MFDGKRTGKFKNLHDLEDVIKSLTATVEKLQGEIIDVENISAHVNNQLKEVNRILNESEVNLSKSTASITSITNNKNFLQSGIDSYRKTIEKLESEIAVLTSENAESAGNDLLSEELRTRLNTLIDEQQRKQELVNTLQIQSAEASQKFNQHNINCIQQQNRIESIKRDAEYKTNQQQVTMQNKANNAEELTQAIEQLTVSKAEFETVENSLVELLTEKQNFETSLTVTETEY